MIRRGVPLVKSVCPPRLGVMISRKLSFHKNDLNNSNLLSYISTTPFSNETLKEFDERIQESIKAFSNSELERLAEIIHYKNIQFYTSEKPANSIISTIRFIFKKQRRNTVNIFF